MGISHVVPVSAGRFDRSRPCDGMRGVCARSTDNGQAHPCSDKALWIPAFAGMTAQTLVRHSREGGNPVILLWNFPVNSLTDHGCGQARRAKWDMDPRPRWRLQRHQDQRERGPDNHAPGGHRGRLRFALASLVGSRRVWQRGLIIRIVRRPIPWPCQCKSVGRRKCCLEQGKRRHGTIPTFDIIAARSYGAASHRG